MEFHCSKSFLTRYFAAKVSLIDCLCKLRIDKMIQPDVVAGPMVGSKRCYLWQCILYETGLMKF